jgi:hypothetical protein
MRRNNAIRKKIPPPAGHFIWPGIAMLTCIAACLGDIISVNIFSRYYPAFNAVAQPISALGAKGSPVARLVSAWWILAGIVFLLFALAWYKSEGIPAREHRLTSWLFALYAAGEEMGSGIFPGNRIMGHLTATGIVHNITGGIGTAALLISPFVLLKKYNRKKSYLINLYLLFVCISGILIFIVFLVSHFKRPGMQWLYMRHGLIQRIFITDYYLYLIVMAFRLYYDKLAGRMTPGFIPLQQP